MTDVTSEIGLQTSLLEHPARFEASRRSLRRRSRMPAGVLGESEALDAHTTVSTCER